MIDSPFLTGVTETRGSSDSKKRNVVSFFLSRLAFGRFEMRAFRDGWNSGAPFSGFDRLSGLV